MFSRCNKGSKSLLHQEIRHAAYNSEMNVDVNKFVYDLHNKKSKGVLGLAYNISTDRIKKDEKYVMEYQMGTISS